MGCVACSSTLTGVKSCTIANSASAGGTTSTSAAPTAGAMSALVCSDGYFTSSASTCSACATASSLLSETGSKVAN